MTQRKNAYYGISVHTIGHMVYGASDATVKENADIEPYRRSALARCAEFGYGTAIADAIRKATTESAITRALATGRMA